MNEESCDSDSETSDSEGRPTSLFPKPEQSLLDIEQTSTPLLEFPQSLNPSLPVPSFGINLHSCSSNNLAVPRPTLPECVPVSPKPDLHSCELPKPILPRPKPKPTLPKPISSNQTVLPVISKPSCLSLDLQKSDLPKPELPRPTPKPILPRPTPKAKPLFPRPTPQPIFPRPKPSSSHCTSTLSEPVPNVPEPVSIALDIPTTSNVSLSPSSSSNQTVIAPAVPKPAPASVLSKTKLPRPKRKNTATPKPPKKRRRLLLQPPDLQVELEDEYGPQGLFEWKSKRYFPTEEFTFDESSSGIVDDVLELGNNCTESECFKAIFDQALVEHIVNETNRYLDQVKAKIDVRPNSKIHKWTNTTVGEIYTFLAVTLLMSHVNKNKLNDYWSTDPLISTPIFGEIFSLDKFLLIIRFLHFANNSNQIQGDRLFKIDVVYQSLKKKFSTVFVPYKKICIDESVVQWKGRLSFKQFLPKKRHRFGVKCFVMCDCRTGFVMDLIIYTGKQTRLEMQSNLGVSGSVVSTMMEPYLGLGHTVYVDNWYTSPLLFQYLYGKTTGAVGTCKPDRQNMAKFPQKMETGEYRSQKTPFLTAEKWVDKKPVLMLSTVHHDVQLVATNKINRLTNEPIKKPKSVIDYNQNMGLIDKADMQMSFNDSARKSTKWYKKLFFHFLDLAVLNSYIIYKIKTGKKPQLGEFRLNLIRQLLQEFTPERPNTTGGRKSKDPAPLRLSARHFPDVIPSTEKKEKPRRACHVCRWTTIGQQRRKDTTWMCRECDVPLCLPECFRTFHSKLNF